MVDQLRQLDNDIIIVFLQVQFATSNQTTDLADVRRIFDADAQRADGQKFLAIAGPDIGTGLIDHMQDAAITLAVELTVDAARTVDTQANAATSGMAHRRGHETGVIRQAAPRVGAVQVDGEMQQVAAAWAASRAAAP